MKCKKINNNNKILIVFLSLVLEANLSYCYQNRQEIDSVKKYSDKLNIIKIGTGFNTFNNYTDKYSIDIEYERGLKILKRVSWAFYYQYIRIKYGVTFINPGSPPKSSLTIAHENSFMLNGKIYPFLFKGEPMNLFYVQGGFIYIHRMVHGVSPYLGPGFTYGGGFQIRIYKNLCADLYYFRGSMADLSPYSVDKKLYDFGHYYGIKIGYKF